MEDQYLIGAACFIVGAFLVYLWRQQSISLLQRQYDKMELERDGLSKTLESKENELSELRKIHQTSETEKASLKEQLNHAQTQDEFLSNAKAQLSDTFKVLATTALDETSQKFRQVAQDDHEKSQKAVADLVKPLRETLSNLENKTEKLADERKKSHTELEREIRNLMQFSHQAQDEVRKIISGDEPIPDSRELGRIHS